MRSAVLAEQQAPKLALNRVEAAYATAKSRTADTIRVWSASGEIVVERQAHQTIAYLLSDWAVAPFPTESLAHWRKVKRQVGNAHMIPRPLIWATNACLCAHEGSKR